MVFGLGNLGPDYQKTRHNAGFSVVDQLAGLLGLSMRKAWFRPFEFCVTRTLGDELVLVKPLTMMNASGRVFPEVLKRFSATVDDILVVFDQMDLPVGRTRLKPHGSPAGHNGLRSIDAALGSQNYYRLAVGIGRPQGGITVVEHVLGVPSLIETDAYNATILRTAQNIAKFWSQGWGRVMDHVNARELSARS